MRLLTSLNILIFASLVAGCGTYAMNQYTYSADNIVELRKYENTKFNIGTFNATEPNQSSFLCRGDVYIDTPNGENIQTFIKNAFISEAKLAGVYDVNESTKLSGNINHIDFDSGWGKDTGHWNISMMITSSNGRSLTVEDSFEYMKTTNDMLRKACNQTGQALVPAVQSILLKLIKHKDFNSLVDKTKLTSS